MTTTIALFTQLSNAHRMSETACVETLLNYIELSDSEQLSIAARAKQLVEKVRNKRLNSGGIDAFMMQYDLSSQEGLALMCLAEALLRIPDNDTADKLIADKIRLGDWQTHAGQSKSWLVNLATRGLMLTEKLVSTKTAAGLRPVIRRAVGHTMKLLGNQFVLGQTIDEAQKRAEKREKRGYRHSYDMLGEAARTKHDALHYQQEYLTAIHAIGKQNHAGNPIQSSGISIKLSALHPRYESAQSQRVFAELLPRVKALCALAKDYKIGLTIDAEEVDRLELSMQLLEKLALDPELKNWDGLGLAIQAYSKRTFYLIDWLADLARRSERRLMVRLVKGAYWDSEIKWSQMAGFHDYPVFTRKVHTDVSYLACAQKILTHTDCFYPQFATHNAHSLSAILELAGEYRDFEFQCLHGMGDTLYDEIVGETGFNIPCRTYAPVGPHRHLLAYLVRRLLENGANSSFVNRIADANVAIDQLIQDPLEKTRQGKALPNPLIPSPQHLYGETRLNAKSIDLNNQAITTELLKNIAAAIKREWSAQPLMAITPESLSTRSRTAITNPANREQIVGHVIESTAQDAAVAIASGKAVFAEWDKTPAVQRAALLNKAADLLEQRMETFMALAIYEAGKSIPNAIAEVREAIDFCRYYAEQAVAHFAKPMNLPGPTGETNQLILSGRGVMICISPWNFPLAIFLGEVTAALAAGNTVVAKPAEQTPLIAAAAVSLLHEAGIPKDVIQLLPGSGEVVGAALVSHADIAGVIFTGSTETARLIQTVLAHKSGPLVPFIAETGGQNCMIVDSSALPEQVVADTISSAFDSAGQRCSALRVLYLQNEIADSVITMLSGAMDELSVGDPSQLNVDIGPVIDEIAQAQLLKHIEIMKNETKLIKQLELKDSTKAGTFVAPTAFEIPSIKTLKREIFGPILHVVRYDAKQLDQVIDDINGTGYGLTFGIHSRIQSTVDYITQRIHAGNIYINRNIVGAVVGVQPFGGEGLSGTGPKAGGPHYLLRLATERTVSTNTTAAGGNASLMSLKEES